MNVFNPTIHHIIRNYLVKVDLNLKDAACVSGLCVQSDFSARQNLNCLLSAKLIQFYLHGGTGSFLLFSGLFNLAKLKTNWRRKSKKCFSTISNFPAFQIVVYKSGEKITSVYFPMEELFSRRWKLAICSLRQPRSLMWRLKNGPVFREGE